MATTDKSNENTDQTISNIDKALQAAKARKNAKAGKADEGSAPASTRTGGNKEKPAKAPGKPRLTDEEKAARKAAQDQARAEKKEARAAAKAAKQAEKAASRAPAHMAKVTKAAEKLGTLGQAAMLLFNEATANLTQAELTTLALHIQHFNRVKATERALNQKLAVGQEVTIVGGEPRYVGKVGTIFKAQRIRCYVTIEGVAKPVYLFTSDVQVNEPAASTATA